MYLLSKTTFYVVVAVVLAVILTLAICGVANAADYAIVPQICILKGTVLDAAGERIPEVAIVATCDTNFIKIEDHSAWLLKYNYTETDNLGRWRLPLIAGLKYELKFVEHWRRRQEYVEEHYYIPFCDSVYFGETNCIE